MPSSDLRIAESLYRQTALDDLLGIPEDKVNDDRLYRTLDRVLVHKDAIEQHLRDRICSGRSETDPPAALKLTHLAARFHTGSATVTEPLEVDFLSAAAFRRWR